MVCCRVCIRWIVTELSKAVESAVPVFYCLWLHRCSEARLIVMMNRRGDILPYRTAVAFLLEFIQHISMITVQ